MVTLADDHNQSDHVPMAHGDLKLDQVLIGSDGTLSLLDWEQFQSAPPFRDVSGVIASILYDALHSIPLKIEDSSDPSTANTVPSEHSIISTGVESIEKSLPLVHCFWRGYESIRGTSSADFCSLTARRRLVHVRADARVRRLRRSSFRNRQDLRLYRQQLDHGSYVLFRTDRGCGVKITRVLRDLELEDCFDMSADGTCAWKGERVHGSNDQERRAGLAAAVRSRGPHGTRADRRFETELAGATPHSARRSIVPAGPTDQDGNLIVRIADVRVRVPSVT